MYRTDNTIVSAISLFYNRTHVCFSMVFHSCYFIYADLFGIPERFFNTKIHERWVFCAWCKGYIGQLKNSDNDVMIKHFRLVRIDPRYLVSICVGQTHDRRGNIMYHQHTTQVQTVENDPRTPVVPMELRSIRGGLLLPRPCVYARELLCSPPITLLDQNSLSVNLPQPIELKIGEIVQKFKSTVAKKRNMKTYGKALEDAVEPPIKIARKANEQKAPQTASSNESFAEYLRNQPSTSRNQYDESVEKKIVARKWQKSNDGASLKSDHSYSQRVCLKLLNSSDNDVNDICAFFFLGNKETNSSNRRKRRKSE